MLLLLALLVSSSRLRILLADSLTPAHLYLHCAQHRCDSETRLPAANLHGSEGRILSGGDSKGAANSFSLTRSPFGGYFNVCVWCLSSSFCWSCFDVCCICLVALRNTWSAVRLTEDHRPGEDKEAGWWRAKLCQAWILMDMIWVNMI